MDSTGTEMFNTEQREAYEGIINFSMGVESGYKVLEGFAGTGKTFVTVRVAKALVKSNKRLLVTAPTQKALKILRKNFLALCGGEMDTRAEFRTIHSAFGLRPEIQGDGTQIFKRDFTIKEIPMDAHSILFVDEMSMLEDTLFEYVNQEVTNRGVKVVFIGDPEQIPPIGKDSSIPCSESGRDNYDMKVYTLKEIVRQAAENPIIQKSIQIRENKEKVRSFEDRNSQVKDGEGVQFMEQAHLSTLLHDLFVNDEFDADPDYAKVIAWTNIVVNRYNDMIRKMRYGDESVHRLVVGEMLIADQPIKDGASNAILFNTNDEMEVLELVTEKEVINGGTEDELILEYYAATVRDLETSKVRQIRVIHESSMELYEQIIGLLRDTAKAYPKTSWKAKEAWRDFYGFIEMWAQIKYNYAITAHKSQGSTYQNAVVMEGDINKNPKLRERNRIKYTACTRPKKILYIV